MKPQNINKIPRLWSRGILHRKLRGSNCYLEQTGTDYSDSVSVIAGSFSSRGHTGSLGNVHDVSGCSRSRASELLESSWIKRTDFTDTTTGVGGIGRRRSRTVSSDGRAHAIVLATVGDSSGS